ncbi:MAG: SirB1 family protein [Dehalococcoidia bacterium]
MNNKEAGGAFAAALKRNDGAIDLLRAAMTLGLIGDPTLDVEAAVAGFLGLADEIRAEIGRPASLADGISALNEGLFSRRGFSGNREQYDDPRNGFMHEALARRTGIPITLALIYIEIGVRLGLPLAGVGFPAHFLVRAGAEPAEYRYIDPFNGGQTLSRDDLAAFLRRQGGDPERQLDTYLAAITPRQVLERMLNNLQNMYTRALQYDRARAAVDFHLVLSPWSFERLRDRGLLSAELGEFDAAVADLRQYLAQEPDSANAAQLRALAERLDRGMH